MMAKIIADLVVILGCGYLGMFAAARGDDGIRRLESIEAILTCMAFQIGFMKLPLASAMARAAQGLDDSVGRLFRVMADGMGRHPNLRPEEAFAAAVDHQPQAPLSRWEQEQLKELFSRMGKGDSQAALDGIRLTLAKMKLEREAAEAKQSKDGKLYRGLGFLGGMFLVLIMI